MKQSKTSRRIPDVAIILTDANRQILWVNEDFTNITGYPLNEVIGKKPSILQGVNTESEVVARIREKLSQHPLQSFKEEITNYRKNGEEYICRLVIHPIFDLNQQLSNFIAFEVDGSKIKDDSDIPMMQLSGRAFRYPTSPLTNHQELGLFTKLVHVVESEQLFLDPKLKMVTLANRLKTNTRYLSQVVNHQTGDNLARFINRYRVEEVKKKIVDESYRYLTTFAIANMCGFNTKSTFYKCFKEITHQTPKEYIQEYNAELKAASEVENENEDAKSTMAKVTFSKIND